MLFDTAVPLDADHPVCGLQNWLISCKSGVHCSTHISIGAAKAVIKDDQEPEIKIIETVPIEVLPKSFSKPTHQVTNRFIN